MIERKPKLVGGGERDRESSEQHTFVQLLEMSLGNRVVAQAAIAHALAAAGRDSLPEHGPELMAFVRAHMVTLLTGELGPRLTIALLDDLAARIDPTVSEPGSGIVSSPGIPSSGVVSTEPPSSMPRRIGRVDFRPSATPIHSALLTVAVVDRDRVLRPNLARALLRAKWAVRIVETLSDLEAVSDEGESIAAAIVDTSHPQASEVLRTLAARYPAAGVILRAHDVPASRVAAGAIGLARHDVQSRDATPEDLVHAIKRTLGL